ncbi:S-layer homology domain-containing protein [Planococcus salinus]|uniref:S-layer homology domain-containing protein n=1 Tax=Planococcus salinus TaxID=1848460 RepID=A0A3M8P6V1_9BACL|nr:S-layer homology domain-containing protein [Planococcus salinus]RNF39151.1 S-layer homology domain-containing protein [Planococcus salinus]
MKTIVSFIAAAVLVFGAFSTSPKAVVLFDDVTASHEFGYEIAYLYEEGIVAGYGNGTFRPYQTITRGQAMAMMGRALGLNDAQRSTSFYDVSAGHPFSGYIASAVDEGIISGFPDNTFRPNATLDRGQAAIIIDQAMMLPDGPQSGFSDMGPNVASNDAVNSLTYEGIANGYPDNRFRPATSVTRAQFSAFLARAVESSFVPEKQELLETANDILGQLQNEDFADVATYVGEDGITFCPYSGGCIDDGGVTFTAAELEDFMQDQQVYLWGHQDGSGFPIELMPAGYYEEYMMEAPYETKERYNYSNQFTTREFIKQVFPQGTIVEFYYPGTEQYDGMDWQSLNMVFERDSNGEWVLVAIVNDRWTI